MIATSQFTISVINDGAPGSTGPQGVSVTKVVTEYRLSDSNTELTGSGTGYTWSETKPDIPSGKYLWERERTDLSNNTSEYGAAHCDIVISGLVQDVDRNSGVITSKVWESYTSSYVNNYDNTTGAAIRDRVTQTETDISGINTTISDIQTNVANKADGSTVQTLTTRVNTISDTVDGHTQTISSNTSRIDNAEDEIESTKTVANQTADKFTWLVDSGTSASNFTLTSRVAELISPQVVIKDPSGSATIITGGKIQANSITTNMLKSDAIKSTNYTASSNASSPYSATGAFLDLNTGSLYMPNFGVNGTTGAAYFNGTVNANAGKFGDDTSYWNIETVYDYNMQPHAALVGTDSPYLQTGNWQVSDNAVATRKYTSTSESAGNATYYKDSGTNTFYDVGMKIPTNFGGYSANDSSVTRYNKAFYYGRKYTGNSVPSLDSDWTYFFEIDSGGNIITAGDVYEGGVKLSEKYAAITDVGSAYLPKTGGTITGNLTVNGSFTTNLQLQTNLGSTSSAQLTGAANAVVKPGVTGTLGVANGGTGVNTFMSGAALIGNGSGAIQTRAIKNNLGNSALGWVSNDASTELVNVNTIAYWNGAYRGTTSNLEYVKLGKLGTVVTHDIEDFITSDGGIVDGSLQVTDLQVGNLMVTGAGRFTNGLYGNLIGNADTATTAATANKVEYNLKVQLNGGTTEGTNQFTYNGSAAKNINITKSSVGLGNVDNTADANKSVKYATSAGSATSATTATSATSATNDSDGNAINTTYVKKSGDTMTADLTLKRSTIDASKTNNNVSSTQYPTTFNIFDTANRILSRQEAIIYANGDIGSFWYVRNYDTSGSQVAQKGIRFIMNKSGTLTYSVSDSSAFRTAIELNNVTNNAQVKGLSSGTTSGHLVTWGADGYTVADSGIANTSVTTKITLAGSDYSASSNTITITQANLQSAVQSNDLKLMTAAERSKLSSIQVSEGGTIDFSGVTASSPLTATVGTNKTVNITHNTSGVTAGTYRSVSVNTYGHVTAGTNPTTLSGYGITDAKIASGVITLGSNTITPLTASSTLDATKLSGTASISTTGNAGSASSANITTTANAVAYYTNTTGSFGSKASANGALYATSANGALNWGTLPIAQGGTGKTTSLAAITALGGPYMLIGGTPITENSNLDTGYNAAGTYYSQDSVRSKTLSGTVPNEFAPSSGDGGCGFKMITSVGYRTNTLRQFAAGSSDRLHYRSSQDAGATWTKWYQIVRLPSNSDNKTFSGIGSSTQPVYVNSSGIVTAATGVLANSISGNAATATTATNAQYLTHKTLDSTTIQNTAGTFAFSGSGEPFVGCDWVGIQVGDNVDKFQICANSNTIAFRQNDSGGTNTSWNEWAYMLTSSNYSSYAVPKTGGTFTGEVISQTGGIWVQGNSAAGGNYNRLTLTSGMPTEFKYNGGKRGTKIYSNAIAFADPYNGNSNNDAGWIRHIEETANSGTLEIATGDDSNELIKVRQYNTSSVIAHEMTLLDSSGNTAVSGRLTIGSSTSAAANTCQLVMNTSTHSLDFVFN